MIFQSLPHGPVVWAIEGTTRSPYSHCGIVAKKGDQWIVYEAYDGVAATPLKTFLFRGRGGGFVVYRLRDKYREHILQTLKCCEDYLGRPYDIRYRLDDEKIYCSELIYKAYRDATSGQQLGELVKFGGMNWQPYETLIKQIENGEVPHEPHEAAREITDLCRAENCRLGIWNCDSGVQFTSGSAHQSLHARRVLARVMAVI